MRILHSSVIVDKVARICQEANSDLGEDVIAALSDALSREESPLGREVIRQIIENSEIARRERTPICQDCGVAVFFVEIGQDLRIEGDPLTEAINEGVRKGYSEGYLRKSMVRNPIDRVNTGDNTPAIIHYDFVSGDRLEITVAPKGGGSENMSAIAMLRPADGVDGIKRFVRDTVERAGANPCPPIVIGVGLGGNFEKAALLAKKSLLRPLGTPNDDPRLARLETEILEEVNSLGIGPQGLGGTVTALAAHVEMFPCHIASLPVAVNIQCHAARHRKVTI